MKIITKKFQELVGRGLSYGTLQKYKTIYLAQFLKNKYATNDIEITKLDYQFIKSFENSKAVVTIPRWTI